MQFIVPKFIEMEDKVIGPLTWRQFLYVAGAGIILIFLWYNLKLFYFIISAIIVGFVAFLFAFYKPQGRPFSVHLKNAINYLLQPKLYIWKKR